MIDILIVDDEKLAREKLRELCKELPNINILGEASNGKEAIEKIKTEKPDLVLLDIQMPLLSGFDVVHFLGDDIPAFIFITAHDEHALKAFEIHAVDYILKPVKKKRLFDAINHLKKFGLHVKSGNIDKLISAQDSALKGFTKLPVNFKNEVLFLEFEDIINLEADGKISWANTTQNKKYRTNFSLKEIEVKLQNEPFLRIHRSHIVNLNHIKTIEPYFKGDYIVVMANDKKLKVAKRRVSELKSVLGIK